MIEVNTIFFFIGALAFVGFLGTMFFKKTRFSDFILLMILGLLAGPVLGIIGGGSVVFLRSVAPFFASIALVILLFEGGLQLNFYRVLKELPKATLFTLLVFGLSVVFAAVMLFVFGWAPLTAVLFGCIVGGTSSAIIVPLVNSISVNDNTKTLLTLESAITDALCVVSAIAVAEVILATASGIQSVFQSILAAFSIAAVLGFIFGIIWLWSLREFKSMQKYSYILTLSALFLLYSVAGFAKGNGAFAALVFGVVLGNAKEFGQMLRMDDISIDSSISVFQAEISLFVRTFFFVYLGVIFDAKFFRADIVVAAVALTTALFFARYVGTAVLARFSGEFSADSKAIRALMARGLAAAVLATYPMATGIAGPNVQTILPLAFLVILLSNIFTSVGVFRSELLGGKAGAEGVAMQDGALGREVPEPGEAGVMTQ